MKPGRASAALALLAAVASLIAVGVTTFATVAGLLGVASIAAAVVFDRPLGVVCGALALAAAIPLASLGGAGTPALVLAAVATALAYDLADAAIETRRLFDSAGRTGRAELAHALGVTVLLGLVGGGVYLVYAATAGATSPLAVALLLLGAVSLTAATCS
jgi:hypothetical protein